MVLCGVRDVRDYRIHSSSENAEIAGGSAFNVRAESLRIGDFTGAEVRALLAQHTGETGQAFTEEALESVWTQTQGQPWLVNALCRRACFDVEAGRDRSRAITVSDLFDAREHLIRSRVVHLDQLADKLREDRVRRVIEPLLSGDERALSARDLEYVRDLGLIARDNPPRIANPIYAEVVPRELTCGPQAGLAQDPAWYVGAGGGLDMHKLLGAFQAFFHMGDVNTGAGDPCVAGHPREGERRGQGDVSAGAGDPCVSSATGGGTNRRDRIPMGGGMCTGRFSIPGCSGAPNSDLPRSGPRSGRRTRRPRCRARCSRSGRAAALRDPASPAR